MNMLSTVGAFFMSASSLILVWNLATSFFRGKERAIIPGTHGHSNGRPLRRRRTKTLLRCRRSAVAARYGTWPIPIGPTRL